MRRTINVLAGTAAMLLVLAGSAFAKGETIGVLLDSTPPGLHAGQPVELGALVTFPDGTLVQGVDRVTFTLSEIGGSRVVQAVAHEDRLAHFVANVTAPAKGGWTVNVTVDFEGMQQTWQPAVLRFEPPIAAPATPASPAAQTAPLWAMVLAVALAAAVAAGGIWIATSRRRARISPRRA